MNRVHGYSVRYSWRGGGGLQCTLFVEGVATVHVISSTKMMLVAVSAAASVGAYLVCCRLIAGMSDMFTRAGLFGRDLNKTSDDKV